MEVISGGAFCISAGLLNKFGIRKKSMPFDWLFCSVANLKSILADDFEGFLDKSKYKSLAAENKNPSARCMHSMYDGLNMERPFFNHKDPTSPADYAYYERCINRFRESCQAGAVLFIIEEFGEINNLFGDLCDVVSQKYPKLVVKAVRHTHEEGIAEIMKIDRHNLHELWLFKGARVKDGIALENPDDEALIVREVLCHGQ